MKIGATGFLFVTLGAVSLLALLLPQRTAAQPGTSKPIPVRGYVVAHLGTTNFAVSGKTHDVYLPGAQVFLRNLSTGRDGASTTTDLSGRFSLSASESGRYEVCVVAQGFQDTCRDGRNEQNLFSLTDQPHLISRVYVTPAKLAEPTAVLYGKVSLSDGTNPRTFEPFGDINAFATITLKSDNGVSFKTPVNNYGEYVFGAVPVKTNLSLMTRLEGIQHEQLVLEPTGLKPQGVYDLPIRLPNRRPTLEPIVALDAAGKQADLARPGDTITLKLRARDDDGDNLRFVWVLSEGAGTLSSTSDQTVKWVLPGRNGRYQLAALAADGRGGYTRQQFAMQVSTGGVPFSGKVIDNLGAVVAGAQVEINGRFVNTKADGVFQMDVPPTARYIMNIRKFGYGLVSKVVDFGLNSVTHIMSRAQVFTVDPTKTITIQHKRSSRDCPPPSATRLPWTKQGDRFGALLEASFQDGRGHTFSADEVRRGRAQGDKRFIMTPPLGVPIRIAGKTVETRFKLSQECGPGVGVRIPANALVDSSGKLPTGKLQIALTTINLSSPEQMPGDYTVLDQNGKLQVMESYGAGTIEVMSGNTRYNLKSGNTADFVLPVDPLQLQASLAPSPTIPLLFYNEKTGIWREDGIAKLIGKNYVAKVKHFSTINSDHTKTDQSCVAIDSSAIPGITKLEYTLPAKSPGAAPINRTYTFESGAGSEHVLYNLPSNVNITLIPIINGTTVTGELGEVPAGVFVVNTSGPQNPTNPNRPVGPPYYTEDAAHHPLGPCGVKVTLTNLASPTRPDGTDEFLQGLNFSATNLDEIGAPGTGARTAVEQGSLNYYAQADPRGLRLDLNSFKQKNGFNDPGAVIVNATYANSGDLGFGRNMNCTKRINPDDGGLDVACYVTNYGDITTPDQQDANNANSNTGPVATVGMEYTRVENPLANAIEFPDNNRTVKFYVYKEALPSTDPAHPGQGNGRALSANLDNVGERPVPQLCVVCHGGFFAQDAGPPVIPAFTTRDDVFMRSRFLPFDLHYYTFPNTGGRDRVAQEPNLRSLNRDYVALAPQPLDPTNDAVTELISAFYPTAISEQDQNATVPNWNTSSGASAADKDFYTRVLARTCRTCHVSSPFDNFSFRLRTEFANNISSVQSRVCDQKVMPHAQRTNNLFWGSVNPNQAGILQQYGQTIPGWNPSNVDAQCSLTQLITGGNVTASFYQAKIQAIFDNASGGPACSSCHGVVGGSGGLSLNFSNSYANLVGIASTELPTMSRVAASNHLNSYLWRKIDGSHVGVGGSGGQMPLVGTLLNTRDTDGNGTNDLLEIQNWIDTGAAGP
jgi:hypothetical protein